MCHLFDRTTRTPFLYDPKTQIWYIKTLRSCFLSSFVELCSAVSEEKLKMPQPIRSQGGHLVFPIGSNFEKHKLGRGRCDLASCPCFVEFRSAVSEEKSKMSQPPNSELLSKLNSMFFNFIWNGKKDKVKRNIMTQNYEKGGLKMIKLDTFILSMKLTWIKRICGTFWKYRV